MLKWSDVMWMIVGGGGESIVSAIQIRKIFYLFIGSELNFTIPLYISLNTGHRKILKHFEVFICSCTSF